MNHFVYGVRCAAFKAALVKVESQIAECRAGIIDPRRSTSMGESDLRDLDALLRKAIGQSREMEIDPTGDGQAFAYLHERLEAKTAELEAKDAEWEAKWEARLDDLDLENLETE